MSSVAKALLVGIVTAVLGLMLFFSPFSAYLEENYGLSFLFKVRGAKEPPPEVVIVSMDKVFAEQINIDSEIPLWPHSLYASLIDYLSKQEASVIALDIFFMNKSDFSEEDRLLAQAIHNAGNVILVENIKKVRTPIKDADGRIKGHLESERLIAPPSLFADSALALAPFTLPKIPRRLSQFWTFKSIPLEMPTLPVVVMQAFCLDYYDTLLQLLQKADASKLDRLPEKKETAMSNKGIEKSMSALREIFSNDPLLAKKVHEQIENSNDSPLSSHSAQKKILKSLLHLYSEGDSRYLNLYGPPGTITIIPFYQLMNDPNLSLHKISNYNFHHKAVFIGFSELYTIEQLDSYYTVFSQSSGIDISGVEIAATAFANLLEDSSIRPVSNSNCFYTVIVWGILMGIVSFLFPSFIAAIVMICMNILYILIIMRIFIHTQMWCPLVIPIFFQTPFAFLGGMIGKYLETCKERKNIKKAFGLYLPDKKVVDQLSKSLVNIKKNDRIVYGTCLITDIEQFTTISETLSPLELSDYMNDYYKAIFGPIHNCAGTISSIVGDSILAIWVTANPDISLENQACKAAIGIIQTSDQFFKSTHNLHLSTRIGLHSGYMFLGNIGTGERYEYTPIGDIVNTASRLENMNKSFGTRILSSKTVISQIKDCLNREIGTFFVAGKKQPIEVYELICPEEEASENETLLCARFKEGLNAFKRKSWEEAVTLFHEALNIGGQKDGPSDFYLKQCNKFLKNPPGEEWNGIIFIRKK